MRTITLQIEDDFLPKFMNVLEVMPKNKIKITQDPMELEIQKRIQEIEDGTLPAVPFDSMWDNIEQKIQKYKNEN
jgi:hypothetical protein